MGELVVSAAWCAHMLFCFASHTERPAGIVLDGRPAPLTSTRAGHPNPAAQVPVVSGLRELAEALEAGGTPRHNGVRRRPDGQLVVDAWPRGLESLLWGGFKGEAWIQPGQEATQARAAAGVGGRQWCLAGVHTRAEAT